MKRGLERGAGTLDAVLIIAFLIFVSFFNLGNNNQNETETKSNWFLGGSMSNPGKVRSTSESPTGVRLTLSSGNARRSYQSYEEYIVLSNRGRTSIDITGFSLKNGKDKRSYNLGGSLQRFSADTAIIPQGSRILSPWGVNTKQNIVLEPGERAIITTGSIGVRSPYKIESFKENICTGYIERLPDYAFEPALQLSCPRASEEPGLELLDTQCQNFVKRWPSCETPQFETKDKNGDPCTNCLKGERLSNACVSFMREHFSYEGCLAYHSKDPNFDSRKTWRVFLGRGWELWAKEYETIEVFDRFNNLVASEEY